MTVEPLFQPTLLVTGTIALVLFIIFEFIIIKGDLAERELSNFLFWNCMNLMMSTAVAFLIDILIQAFMRYTKNLLIAIGIITLIVVFKLVLWAIYLKVNKYD